MALKAIGCQPGPVNGKFQTKLLKKNFFTSSAQEQKFEAQIEAATRSIHTNMFLIAMFIISQILIIWFKKETRAFYAAIIFTTLKGVLPIFSTICNFGTIQSVIMEYYKYFLQILPSNENAVIFTIT